MSIHAFLRDVERLVVKSGSKDLGENDIFSKNVQMLDGFKVGFMRPRLFAKLCKKHGLNPRTSEAILMQTTNRTEPHVHLNGNSTFLALGKKHGYKKSGGGTYLGTYTPSKKRYMLSFVPAREGKTFDVRANTIHFFAPDAGATFSALAFVSPRIQRDDGTFDMMHFTKPRISTNGTRASIATA